MPVIAMVIICSLVGGAFSLVGGLILSISRRVEVFAGYATAFAAGALLAAAFMDLLPEAIEETAAGSTLAFTMIGLIAFFLLESCVNWFHKHDHPPEEHDDNEVLVPMVVLGDTLHNAIDGAAIAAGFLVSPVSGVIVTLAIAAHEIPQEIGDFGIMLHSGVSRNRTILINLASALAATVSAVIFYLLGDAVEITLAPLLGIVAGFFIYIAATDIIPTIHKERDRLVQLKKAFWLIAGVVVVSLAVAALHTFANTLGLEL
ncbi:MAG: ZIP family metal transporter [Coriobacteriales bacterium]|nr:ZIP family metal transporter [Coriobacteriales bacterium]